MSSIQRFPKIVGKFLDAAAKRDVDALTSTFRKSGVVNDEARDYKGRDAIRGWVHTIFVHLKTNIHLETSTQEDGKTLLSTIVDGDFAAEYGITKSIKLDMYFTIVDDLISELYITDIPRGTPTMGAVYAIKKDFDNPLDSLRIGRRRLPTVQEGWVRVKVSAASINWHDVWTLRGVGMYPFSYPITMGVDGVGTLDDGTEIILYPVLGNPDFKDDETLDPNRNVLSELTSGTFAEYVKVPLRNVVPLPPQLSPIAAASLGTAWLTAYRMLFTKSDLRAGQTMLVQGSSGGITTALIQLGNAAGMIVWATGRTEEKRDLAKSLGASQVFPPGEKLPHKVDAVFNASGEAVLNESFEAIKTGGTIVLCGSHGGGIAKVDLNRIFVEQISLRGAYMGTLEEFKNLVDFVAVKGIKPRIGKVLPWNQAEEGFRDIWEGTTSGKVVLQF
jgi:NADPH:quinone reductase-like Zn-dependent oxidoreductase